MSSANFRMSSVYPAICVIFAAVILCAQADAKAKDNSMDKTTSPKEPSKASSHNGGTEDKGPSQEELLQLVNDFIANSEKLYGQGRTSTKPVRTKRWAQQSYSGASSGNYKQRFRYPSNLMAMLRGKKGGDLMASDRKRWQLPSNLMVLLRGKKSVEEEDEDDMDLLDDIAESNVIRRSADGWQYFLDNYYPEYKVKRSAYYGYYNPRRASSYAGRPTSARQFLMWNGGRYVLG